MFPDADIYNMNPYEQYILNNYTPEEIREEAARLRREGKWDLIVTIDPNWGDRLPREKTE